MNIILLTLAAITDISKREIYTDLMRKFRDEGHRVYLVSPAERRFGLETSLIESEGVNILKVKTLNIQKTNILEKGIGTLLIERQYISAIKKYLGDIKFDLITYSTPPITFSNVIRYLKKKNPQAISYLQLKDIFPQNAVDIGMFGKKSIFYWFFRRKETRLYKISDYIGCMSPANVKYVLDHNDYIDANRVEVAPNSIDIEDVLMENGQYETERDYIRSKYNLPADKPIFIYGGNLGRPQGVDYLIKCLNAVKHKKDCFFLIVGNGTEYSKLENWRSSVRSMGLELNFKLMSRVDRKDYDMLVRCCDVGLIFLNHRFTIPNYPSRLLNYLECRLPIICATDVNTDIGKIAEENGYGYWCESVKPEDFVSMVDKMLTSDRKTMGEKGYQFLKENYLVEHTYNAIMRHLKP